MAPCRRAAKAMLKATLKATGGTTTRHNDGNGWHNGGKGQHSDGRHNNGNGWHDKAAR
jgi:hypothetical protein